MKVQGARATVPNLKPPPGMVLAWWPSRQHTQCTYVCMYIYIYTIYTHICSFRDVFVYFVLVHFFVYIAKFISLKGLDPRRHLNFSSFSSEVLARSRLLVLCHPS